MKSFGKYFLLYLETIFQETTTLVSGFAGFVIISVVGSLNIKELKNINSLQLGGIVFFICILIAHYRIIVKLIKKNEDLSEEIIDLKKVDTDFDIQIIRIEKTFDEEWNKNEKEMEWAEDQLIPPPANMTISRAISNTGLKEDAVKSYLEELKEYKKNLEIVRKSHFFNLVFIVKNSGNRFEEEILIRVHPDEGVFRFVTKSPLLDVLRFKPERPKNFWENLAMPLASVPSLRNRDYGVPDHSMYINSNNKVLDLEISKLVVNDSRTFDDSDIFIELKETGLTQFNFEIATKNTQKPIKKKIASVN